MKFEKDFDFESANAQFNKEEIDREFHNKLKLKGKTIFALDLSMEKLCLAVLILPWRAALKRHIVLGFVCSH